MSRKRPDAARLTAVLVTVLAVFYFHLNLFHPQSIPKSLRLGVLRRPLTILVVGTDITYNAETRRPMVGKEGRADTILFTRIDPIHSRISVLSIPRDTLLSIPGHAEQKINVANAYGGTPLMLRTISEFTGREIDYYIKVKPTAVSKMADEIGGVTLYVEEDMRYVDRAQRLDINLKKGWQKLSGKDAHDYIRYRDDYGGDIKRIKRQQKFLRALFLALLKPSNIFRAPLAISASLEEIDTNIPLPTAIRVLNLTRMLELENLTTVLASGEVSMVKGVGSVWLPDREGVARQVRAMF